MRHVAPAWPGRAAASGCFLIHVLAGDVTRLNGVFLNRLGDARCRLMWMGMQPQLYAGSRYGTDWPKVSAITRPRSQTIADGLEGCPVMGRIVLKLRGRLSRTSAPACGRGELLPLGEPQLVGGLRHRPVHPAAVTSPAVNSCVVLFALMLSRFPQSMRFGFLVGLRSDFSRFLRENRPLPDYAGLSGTCSHAQT